MPETLGPISPVDALQRRVAVDLAGQRPHADGQQRPQRRRRREECPSENQNPTDSGRLPSAMSLRVVLSIAAMWSASKACRMPRE